MVDIGFQKGTSDNLPTVDVNMVDSFYMKMVGSSTETKFSKAKRSTRATYGDNAIAYVQIKREGPLCTVKARITPEHKIHNKYYHITAIINEEKNEIQSCECISCATCADHCKHAIAFIFWLHRRSEEPSVTSQECYWKKSVLSSVGRDHPSDLNSICGGKVPPIEKTGQNFRTVLIETCKGAEGGIFDICSKSSYEDVGVHHLGINYSPNINADPIAEEFFQFMKDKMDTTLLKEIEERTQDQGENPLWYEMRYGRITASKIYEASVCNTLSGSLVQNILGESHFKMTEPMKRGLSLEKEIISQLQIDRNIIIKKSGLILNQDYPIFGASPDGISDEYVIEIKCPSTDKTVQNYIDNNKIKEKYLTQIQIQMLFANKCKGIFCVANPNFENNRKLTVIEVKFDKDFCENKIKKCKEFWTQAIFPKIIEKKE